MAAKSEAGSGKTESASRRAARQAQLKAQLDVLQHQYDALSQQYNRELDTLSAGKHNKQQSQQSVTPIGFSLGDAQAIWSPAPAQPVIQPQPAVPAQPSAPSLIDIQKLKVTPLKRKTGDDAKNSQLSLNSLLKGVRLSDVAHGRVAGTDDQPGVCTCPARAAQGGGRC